MTPTTDTPDTFEAWRSRVNRLVGRLVGLDLDDLNDCPYYDWYDAGVRPLTAARRAIKRAGGA